MGVKASEIFKVVWNLAGIIASESGKGVTTLRRFQLPSSKSELGSLCLSTTTCSIQR